jgi:exodeoxyribonuclease V gamma subunit
MLYFIQSNRLENLFDRLCQVLGESPPSPLQSQEIVVQNPGMARWVSQQIALRQGIAANLGFPLPARFIWQILAGQLELEDDEGAFDRSVLRWRILAQLTGPVRQDLSAGVAGYLSDDQDGRKAFHLAGKIADLFDQYLVYRPDMLLKWESAPGSDWQAALWNTIAASSGQHRARLLRHFRHKALQGELDPLSLPKRIHIFGVSSLAPVYLEIIHAVSSVADIYLFHLSPCRDYWADLASDREIARKRAGSPQADVREGYGYFDTGNPILAALGKVGREFVSLVYDLTMIEEEHYLIPEGDSMLTCLQRDILDLVDHSDPAVEKMLINERDHSVQLHSCHNRMREVQVLHDRLLELFELDPELKPGDILVMAPGIEEYASAISSIFGGAEEDTFIPWSLADRSFRGEAPLADSFLNLFELCAGRCSAPEVVSLLENGAIMRRFKIDEEGLATIRTWIAESGIRWGLDLEHRQDFSPGMDETHSWSFGLNRLFMGYLMGVEPEPVHGISPCGTMSTGEGILLGRLAGFLERLRQTREQLAGERSPAEWAALLLKLLDDWYDPGHSEEEQQALFALRETICALDDACRRAGFTTTVKSPVIRAWFNETLAGPAVGQPFLSGRVTFCNMVPMRSVPFAVICLLGMNDTAYPRHQSSVGFDLIARDPRPGDRNRRDDDRYLFLEALVSARRVFYLSWLGRNQMDNSPRPPSVVVSDLIDYLGRSFVDAAGTPLAPPIIEHPLQPFSTRCFDGTAGTASYARQWLPATDHGNEKIFIAQPLPDPAEEFRTVDLSRLVQFWSHPVRFFLQQRLGMQLREEHDLLEESEPFQPDHLERYTLADRLIAARLLDQSGDTLYAGLRAEGLLPHGNFGRNVYRELRENADSLVPEILSLIQEPTDPLEVDLAIDPYVLKGWLNGLFATGCIRYRPAKLKGRDLVKLWVEHLVYNTLNPAEYRSRSVYIAGDATVAFIPVQEPLSELRKLLDLYWQGLSAPLHFYPETSRAWFAAKEERKEYEALKAWNSGFNRRGEGEGLEYRIALRGASPLDPDFTRLAAAVYGPLYAHLEDGHAEV